MTKNRSGLLFFWDPVYFALWLYSLRRVPGPTAPVTKGAFSLHGAARSRQLPNVRDVIQDRKIQVKILRTGARSQ